jgi:hypothetical protein
MHTECVSLRTSGFTLGIQLVGFDVPAVEFRLAWLFIADVEVAYTKVVCAIVEDVSQALRFFWDSDEDLIALVHLVVHALSCS